MVHNSNIAEVNAPQGGNITVQGVDANHNVLATDTGVLAPRVLMRLKHRIKILDFMRFRKSGLVERKDNSFFITKQKQPLQVRFKDLH